MSTKTRLLLPFALLFSLAATACPSSDDERGAADGAGGVGGRSGPADEGKRTSCVFEYSTSFVCSDSTAKPTNTGPDVRCADNSECGLRTSESDVNRALHCTLFTYRKRQRVYEGTCDEYRATVNGGGEPQFPECTATLDLRRCAECARAQCCDEMTKCAGSAECVNYVSCSYACEDRFLGDKEALSACRTQCRGAYPQAEAPVAVLRDCASRDDCGCGTI